MLSAPPPEAHPTHSVGTDMDTADAEIEPDPPVQIQSQQDVGVQVVPSRKNARIQARPTSFSVG